LREREEDIELLARYFLHEISRTMGFDKKDFTEGAVSAMLRYSWPGNIMEMENKIRRAIVLSRGPVLTESDLEIRPEDFEPVPQLADAKENFEKAYIEKVLRYHHGDKEKTAKVLGVNVRTIYRYLGKGG
jgi:DNA-binding NtrC family response regulator